MILQKEIKDKLKKILNENTQDLLFEVDLYEYRRDAEFKLQKYIEDSYEIAEIPYIPVVIESLFGEYEDLKDVDVVNIESVISFLVPTEEQDVRNTLLQINSEKLFTSIDEARREYKTKSIPIGEEGYRIYDEQSIEFEATESMGKFTIGFWLNDNEPQTIVDMSGWGKIDVSQAGNLRLDTQLPSVTYATEAKAKKFYEVTYLTKFEDDQWNLYIYLNEEEVLKEEDVGGGFIGGSFTVESFEGCVSYVGASKSSESEGFTDLLVENFDTLKNEAEEQDYTITPTDKYGVTNLGLLGQMTFTFTVPNPTTQQFTYGLEGLLMQIYDWAISIQYTDNVFLGNHKRYFLDGNEIFPIARNEGTHSEDEAEQYVGQKQAKSAIRELVRGYSFSLLHKNSRGTNQLHKKLFSSDREMNQKFTFEIRYPTFKEEFEVLVNQTGSEDTYNTPSNFSFDLVLADDHY